MADAGPGSGSAACSGSGAITLRRNASGVPSMRSCQGCVGSSSLACSAARSSSVISAHGGLTSGGSGMLVASGAGSCGSAASPSCACVGRLSSGSSGGSGRRKIAGLALHLGSVDADACSEPGTACGSEKSRRSVLDAGGALDASSACADPASDCDCVSMRMMSCRNAGLFWFSATMRCKSIAKMLDKAGGGSGHCC